MCSTAAESDTATRGVNRAARLHHLSRRCAFQEDAMNALVNFYNSIRRNDEGQDLLEYALLVALIAIVAVGAVTTAGETVAQIFTDIAGQI
jgi:Flp pilus assembly pilin Flp